MERMTARLIGGPFDGWTGEVQCIGIRLNFPGCENYEGQYLLRPGSSLESEAVYAWRTDVAAPFQRSLSATP
jgi:hypothetical protein